MGIAGTPLSGKNEIPRIPPAACAALNFFLIHSGTY